MLGHEKNKQLKSNDKFNLSSSKYQLQLGLFVLNIVK